MEDTLLGLISLYSFEFAFLGMFAGVLYFSLERNSLALEYRHVATLAAVVSLVAAVNYWHMTDVVKLAMAEGETLETFPTHYRYIDWIITTPLLLAMIVSLLGIRDGAGRILTGLIIADVIMIASGYVGEIQVNMANGSMGIAWTGFIISMFCWLYILFVLYSVLSSYSAQQPLAIQKALNTLRLFIVLGWIIYPLGYFITLLGAGDSLKITREIIYCVADVVNKVGFGMVAIHAARVASFVWKEE